MGEWISILLNSDAFSEEEQKLLLTLAKTDKIEPYCILALKTQFSRYLHPKSVEKNEPYDTILDKLANIEDYLAKGVIPVQKQEERIIEPVITPVIPITEVQELKQNTQPKKSNAKLNKLKKLRGG